MDLNYKGIQYDTYEKLHLGIIHAFNAKEINKEEFLKLNNEIRPFRKEEGRNNMIKFWKNFNTILTDPKDVPTIHLFGKDYQNYVIPALIRNGAIPKKDIKNGHFYYGEWRAGQFGKWDKEKGQFYIWRNKWNQWYLDQANHFENDDNYALFVPLKEITEEQFNNREI